MKNIKQLKAHCEKVYNNKIKEAKKQQFRLDSRGVRVAMTPAGLKTELKAIEKRKAAALARIDAAARDSIKDLTIKIEWHKSRNWDNNPAAQVEIRTTGGEYITLQGKASGCGYDKESAAIAAALSGCAVYDNFIFNNYKKAINGHPFYYSDRDPLPFLEVSGCGVGVLEKWAKMAGYKWHEEHGKKWDFYSITK